MSDKPTCSICLNTCIKPLDLTYSLYCDCKYDVHYKCFYTWWKDNKTCIICHRSCGKPLNKKELMDTINRRKKIKNRRHRTPERISAQLRVRARYGVDTRRIAYPEDRRLQHIEEYLQRLHFDNENELRAILFILLISLTIIFVYKIIYAN